MLLKFCARDGCLALDPVMLVAKPEASGYSKYHLCLSGGFVFSLLYFFGKIFVYTQGGR